MDVYDIDHYLKYLVGQGYTLNIEELTAIQAGLTTLKRDRNYSKIYFWGKIFGATNDYYIAYGLHDVDYEFPSKKFFFATNDFVFAELPNITEDEADAIVRLEEANIVSGTFTGDPGMPLGQGSGICDELLITEAHRLAQSVLDIDMDTAVVPKGAYVLNESNQVMQSSTFKGLAFSAAEDLASYVHFRPAADVTKLRALAADDVQFYNSFFDPLTGDLPKGSWSMRTDTSYSHVVLRSLVWPGYSAMHIPGTPKFGGLYIGHALKNKDLPFLM